MARCLFWQWVIYGVSNCYFLERWQIIFAKNKIFTLLFVCYIYKTYICYILIKTI